MPIPATAPVPPAASPFKFDKTLAGWELLEDVEPTVVDAAKLELVAFLREDESSTNGEELARRAIELKANLGQRDAERLLESQHLIPVGWRGNTLVFPGTKWRHPDGYRLVLYLDWRGEQWRPNFSRLELAWLPYDRLVRLSNQAIGE